MHPSMHSPYPCLLSISPQRLIKSWINDDYMNKVTVPALGLDDWSLLGMLAVHINILNFSLNFSLAWGKVFSLSGHFLPNLRKILVAGILGRESSWKRVYYILRNPSRFRKPPNSPLRLRHAHMCHDNSESKDSLGTPRHKYSRYIYIYILWMRVGLGYPQNMHVFVEAAKFNSTIWPTTPQTCASKKSCTSARSSSTLSPTWWSSDDPTTIKGQVWGLSHLPILFNRKAGLDSEIPQMVV